MATEAPDLQRLARRLSATFTPQQLTAPAAADEPGLLTNLVGGWFLAWECPDGPPTGDEPTAREAARFAVSAAEALRLDHSSAVLFAAAEAAGRDRVPTIDGHLKALQAAVTAQLAAPDRA